MYASISDEGNRHRRLTRSPPILNVKVSIAQLFDSLVDWTESCTKQHFIVHVPGQNHFQFSPCIVFHKHRTSAPKLGQTHCPVKRSRARRYRNLGISVKPYASLSGSCVWECSNCGQSTRRCTDVNCPIHRHSRKGGSTHIKHHTGHQTHRSRHRDLHCNPRGCRSICPVRCNLWIQMSRNNQSVSGLNVVSVPICSAHLTRGS